LNELGISAMIFDMDDTVYDTTALFERKLDEFYQFMDNVLLSSNLGIDSEDFKQSFIKAEYNCYMNGQIDLLSNTKNILQKILPEKYLTFLDKGSIEELDENELKLMEKVLSELLEQQILHQIYQQVPDFLPGTEDFIKILNEINCDFGFCTHSGDTWGDLKLLPFIELIDKKDIYLNSIAVDSKKDASSWTFSIESMGKTADEIVAVGDNPKADILAAYEAGVRKMIYVNKMMNKNEIVEDLRAKGAVIWEVRNPGEIVEALLLS
jgi:FMN phosphatase YigB (HAD superfamily)